MTSNREQRGNQTDQAERLRRPAPERKKPRRDVLGALGQSDSLLNDTMRDDFSFESWHPLGPGFSDTESPAQRGEQPAANSRNFIEQGVRAASDLVDAHIRQGEETAKSLGDSAWKKTLSQPDLSALLTGLVRAYSDAAAVWMQIMGSLTQNLEDQEGKAADRSSTTIASANIGLNVRCECSVEVALEMFRKTGGILPQPLISATSDTQATISGIRYEAAETEAAGRICIVVPAGQAPGTYHGLLLSTSDNMPAGVVTLRIPGDDCDETTP